MENKTTTDPLVLVGQKYRCLDGAVLVVSKIDPKYIFYEYISEATGNPIAKSYEPIEDFKKYVEEGKIQQI